MKVRAALMLCTALLMPTVAGADPVSAFFVALAEGTATSAAVAGAIGGLTGFAYSAGVFFTTTFGSLLLSVGLNAAIAALNKPDAPTIDAARVNSRTIASTRWQMGGSVVVGGEAGIFGEYDDDGNFWYIVAHGDAEITNDPVYLLDNIQVELSDGTDGFTAGDVLTDDFCLTSGFEQFEGAGTRVPYFRLYTVSPSAGSVVGAMPSDFTAAFPNLPSDFKIAGVAFTVVRCKSVPLAHYNKVFRWRGAFSLGEPAIAAYANFNRMYDPRNEAHDIGDRATWTASDGNPAIIWAWWRTAPYGRNRPMSEVNWAKVAAEADKCDATVLDRSSEAIPLYRCGVAFPDNKPRAQCEAEILKTCDGFVVYDDQGRAWPRVGVYEAPTLQFTAARDIMSMQTQIIDDGETAVDGVVVNYISADHGYTKQAAAPWRNTRYYNGSGEPNYLFVDVLGIQNHNQAVRIAKAIGLRAGAPARAALGVGIKGILARGERVIDLVLDAEFTGDFEIATPVEENEGGTAAAFAVVPMQLDRYTLNEGEEGAPPVFSPALDIDDGLEVAGSVSIIAAPISVSSAAAVRLQATFAALSRIDRSFRFRYKIGTDPHEYFVVDMDELLGYTGILPDGADARVSWQTVTAGGRASLWSDERDTPEYVDITATANPTGPDALASLSADAGIVTFTTANDPNQHTVGLRRGTTTTFGASSSIDVVFAGPNVTVAYDDTGLAAGDYYYWAIPRNASGVSGTRTGPVLSTIT